MNRLTRYSLLVILLVAFFFRTHELAGLGLGLEHDEVAEWQIANGIRHGENALFFKEAYGQEPLFLYLMAGSTALIGDNVIGVRFRNRPAELSDAAQDEAIEQGIREGVSGGLPPTAILDFLFDGIRSPGSFTFLPIRDRRMRSAAGLIVFWKLQRLRKRR